MIHHYVEIISTYSVGISKSLCRCRRGLRAPRYLCILSPRLMHDPSIATSLLRVARDFSNYPAPCSRILVRKLASAHDSPVKDNSTQPSSLDTMTSVTERAC